MKKELSDFVALSLEGIQEINNVEDLVSKIEVSETKNKAHGDYSTNIALILSKELKIFSDFVKFSLKTCFLLRA